MKQVSKSLSDLSFESGLNGLSRSETIVEIENSISEILSEWYGFDVVALLGEDHQFVATGYSDSGGLVQQKNIDLKEIKGSSTIRRAVKVGLQKAAVLKQVAQYKKYERELCWGEIISSDCERNLFVEIEIVPGERVISVCPLNRIGVHERDSGKFSIGQRRAFHLRRVEPVLLNGTPRLKVVVDRVSKTLVENLLKSQLGSDATKKKIRCVKRYVGHKSIVVSSRKLPKSAIMAVDRELCERVQVEFDKSMFKK